MLLKNRFSEEKSKNLVQQIVKNTFVIPIKLNLIVALAIFMYLGLVVTLSEAIFHVNPKLIVPLLSSFTQNRIWILVALLPILFLYFMIDGEILMKIKRKEQKNLPLLVNGVELSLIKNSIFILLLMMQYLPLFLFDFLLIGGFLAFTFQFLMLIVPLFSIYIFIMLYYVKNDLKIAGALINSILFGWTLVIALPKI